MPLPVQSRLSPSSSENPPCRDIVVGVADMKLSKEPGTALTTYALGSCLGITFFEPHRKIGAMLHAMLPDSALHHGQKINVPMFVDTGLQAVIKNFQQLGCSVHHLECKVFGGAQVMSADHFFNIGSRNFKAFVEIAGKLGLRVLVSEVGGQVNRTLRFYVDTGKVSVRTPNQPLFWR